MCLCTAQEVDKPLLGRPLVEALCFDIEAALLAVAKRFADGVSEAKLQINASKELSVQIAGVLQGVYHAYGSE